MRQSRGPLPSTVRTLGLVVALGLPLCWTNVLYVRWAPYVAAVAFPVGFLLYLVALVWLVVVVGHVFVGYRLRMADGLCLVVVLAGALLMLS